MPVALAIIGLCMVIAGARGQGGNLGRQLGSDFDRGFLAWIAAIFMIGFLGYIPAFSKASRGLLVLIIFVYLLGNNGVFAQVEAVAKSPPKSDPEDNVNVKPTPPQSSSSGGGSSGGGIGGLISGAASLFSLF